MPQDIATLHDIVSMFDDHGDRPALLAVQTEGIDQWTFDRLADHTRRLAAGLREAGLEPGERAALLAPNRPEWIVACFGVIEAGGVPVLIDAQTGPDALRRVLDDSGASWVFSTSGIAQPEPHPDPASEAESRQPQRQERPEGGGGVSVEAPPASPQPSFPPPFSDRRVVLLDAGDDQPGSWRRLLADEPLEAAGADPEDLAVLFYTSGTSGAAKGVPLSHRNLASNIRTLMRMDLVAPTDRLMLPLPLHHVYPFSVGMLLPLATGVPMILPESLTGPELVRAMKEGGATDLLAVPRLLSALMAAIEGRVAERGRTAAMLFHAMLATSTALRWRLGLRVGRRLFAKLHRQMAPELHTVASGGSPIEARMARRLEGLGWRFADGYGLTETAPVVAFNLPGRARIGTVGRPIDGVDVRIAEPRDGQSHGEIEVTGPNVFSGYWNRPEETEAAFTSDGYFRTGDLGELDGGGYLRVLGRASSLIVMPGGENVWPEDVEQALAGSDRIAEAGVLLHDEKLVAVVVPESEPFRGAGREEVESEVRDAVSRIARTLPSHHRVARVEVTRQPLERTRLGKLRRHLLKERYEELRRHGDRAEQPAGPVAVEEMPEKVRALFRSPAVGRTWDWLAERFSDVRLAPETHLGADLGVDSMEWLRLGLEIQQRTGHALPEEAVRRIETVEDLLREVAEAREREPAEAEDLIRRLREPEKHLDEDQRHWLRTPGLPVRAVGAVCRAARILLRGWVRMRVVGREHVSGTEPVIILPNHRSLLDAPALFAALPPQRLRRATWGGAVSVMFRSRFMRLLSRANRVIPIDPQRGSAASLALAAAALDRGDTLMWFPEGGVSRSGQLQPFLPGIGLLLEAHLRPVVPVWIAGSREALPRGSWWLRFHRVTVRFGEPIDPDNIPREGESEVDRAQRAADFLRDRVAELGKNPNPH